MDADDSQTPKPGSGLAAYSPDGLDAAYSEFAEEQPGYANNAHLSELRERDYSRLDRLGHVYLDYTGGGLYAESQVRKHLALLGDNVLGNPHSHNPTSLASTQLVEEARDAVLAFFNADPEEYDVVFTPNASGALKLVGESYPFEAGDRYLLTYDNHNSVNGIREFARTRGASVTYLPVGAPELRLDCAMVEAELGRAKAGQNNLFAFPAQSNFSGVQHPLEWIETARANGWDVLLDCAAFAPTNRLDLSAIRPDFVPLSFYKMFGYPTGVGALIARKEALGKLRRPWFAGGTITLASVQGEGWYHLAPGHTGFEDGTVDYLGLPAVRIGLEHIAEAGIDAIHERVVALTSWLLGEMTALRHTSGAPMVLVFGPTDMECRGATIAFYLLDPAGDVFDVHLLENLAGRELISLRTGCFCNPGDGEIAHQIERDEMAECFVGKPRPVTFEECHEIIRDATGKMPNTMRVSLGLASNFADVYRFMAFAAGFRDRTAEEVGRL
jgi:molybdenum cofactor sulfurtransferase